MGFWEIINDRKSYPLTDLSMQFYQNVSFNSADIRREKVTRFSSCYVSDIAINQIKLMKYWESNGGKRQNAKKDRV